MLCVFCCSASAPTPTRIERLRCAPMSVLPSAVMGLLFGRYDDSLALSSERVRAPAVACG